MFARVLSVALLLSTAFAVTPFNNNRLREVVGRGKHVTVNEESVLRADSCTTHYGDPSQGCCSDEEDIKVSGISGDFCSPECDSDGSCPTDVPSGVTATPQCLLENPLTGQKYCALECDPSDSGECGDATCQAVSDMLANLGADEGICTYSD